MHAARTPLVAIGAVILLLGMADRSFAEGAAGEPENLSLPQFLREVTLYNPAVQEGWLQWLIKSRDARAAWGSFEPALTGSYKLNSLVQQNTALEQYQQLGTSIYDERNDVYSLGIGGNLPTGASYTVGTSVTRLQDTYVESGQYRSFVGVSAQQPLLKGATHGAAMAGIRVSFEDRVIAFHQYRKQLMTIVTQAETAYWNLAVAQEASRMAAEAVGIAQHLLQVAEQGAAIGRMSRLDVEQAQAELSSRLTVQNDSELSVSDAETSLRLLLGAPGERRSGRIVASDPLVESTAPDGDRALLLEWALRSQPDLMIATEQLRRQDVLVGFQQDQTLPELNLTGSYGYTGLGNTVQESMANLESQDYPAWSVGVEVRIPLLLDVKQRNELKSEQLKKSLADLRLQATRDQVTRSITNLVHDIDTLRRRIGNARSFTETKSRLLEVETARLEAGTVGIVEVYNAQDALSQARQRELQAALQYRRALLQLEVASGTVLRDQGFERLEEGQIVLSDELRSRE